MFETGDTSLEAIAHRLKLLRIALEVSQVQVCRATNISPTAWSNYECGLRRISLDNALAVKKQFGVGLDFIYWGDPAGLEQQLYRLLTRTS